MVAHKKFLMLYLSGMDVEFRVNSKTTWRVFDVYYDSLAIFNNDMYEFRIKPDDDCVSIVDSNVKPLSNIGCEVAML